MEESIGLPTSVLELEDARAEGPGLQDDIPSSSLIDNFFQATPGTPRPAESAVAVLQQPYDLPTLSNQLTEVLQKTEQLSYDDLRGALEFSMSQLGTNNIFSITELGNLNPVLHEQILQLKAAVEQKAPTPEQIANDQSRQIENVKEVSALLGISVPDSLNITELTPDNLSDLEITEDGQELKANITNPDGTTQEVSFARLAVLALFVTSDLLLFKGNLCHTLMNVGESATMLGQLLNLDLSEYKLKFGSSFYNELFNDMTTDSIVRFLEKRTPEETYKFLEQLDLNTRERVVSGKSFGGDFQNRHILKPEVIQEHIVAKLRQDQINTLRISHLVKPAQPAT